MKVGANELVRKFTDFYDDYNSKWANIDEDDDNMYKKSMIVTEVMPQVEKNL